MNFPGIVYPASQCFPATWRETTSKCTTMFLALAIFLVPFECFGKEEEFPAYNCAITPPDGWTLVTDFPPPPGMFALFRKADQMAILLLLVDEKNPPTGPIDKQFIIDYDKGVESSGGGKRISGRFVEVDGIKAYERTGSVEIKGKHASTLDVLVPGDGKYYSVHSMRFDGEAGDDPEIRKALASFRFLQAPATPVRSSHSDSAAYRFGESTGSVGMVAIVIFILVGALKGKRSDKPGTPRRGTGTPPPLPPER